MSNIKWFFPGSEAECLKLLDDGYKPHGGGTFLVKTALNIKGLFVLPDDGIFNGCSIKDDSVIIGSSVTYKDAGQFLEDNSPGNFFSKALLSAAATPLRNRITIGGSAVAAPKWSDLAGPLSASDAVIEISGSGKTAVYSDFKNNMKPGSSSLVRLISIPLKNITGSYFRFTLTGFDYPFFTLTLSDRKKTLFCAVTGCRTGTIVFSGTSSEIINSFDAEVFFNDERGLSGKYLKKRAAVELSRMLEDTSDE